jgi:hypothetical protein
MQYQAVYIVWSNVLGFLSFAVFFTQALLAEIDKHCGKVENTKEGVRSLLRH